MAVVNGSLLVMIESATYIAPKMIPERVVCHMVIF